MARANSKGFSRIRAVHPVVHIRCDIRAYVTHITSRQSNFDVDIGRAIYLRITTLFIPDFQRERSTKPDFLDTASYAVCGLWLTLYPFGARMDAQKVSELDEVNEGF
jgi:hypothetical protein